MKFILRLLTFLAVIIFISCERPVDPVSVDDGIPPAVPSGLRFYAATDGEIVIEWNLNSENDLSGYNIYRKVSGGEFQKLFSTRNDYYYDDSLDYNTEYFYRITAVDNAGAESLPTEIISAMPINRYKPLLPLYPDINARNWEGKKSVYLSWQAGEETDVDGYKIYRSESSTFPADSTTNIGSTKNIFFNDTSAQSTYKMYYYKIRTLDKGGLVSNETSTLSDFIHEIPVMITPVNNSTTEYFSDFAIKALPIPTKYKIIVQDNEFFGEIWSAAFNSSETNGTLLIKFSASYIEAGKKYFWRIITYSGSDEPNSISNLFNFTLK